VPAVTNAELERRIGALEAQLKVLAVEAAAIRAKLEAEEDEPVRLADLRPFAAPEDVPLLAASQPKPILPRPAPPPGRPGAFARAEQRLDAIDPSDLLDARTLAVAGGIVTLLGIVFFFVLAVNRGWIGPDVRVLCGGLASALAFGAGLWTQRRHGETHAALAAVGAGIAGAYVTLLAATALYHLIPEWGALLVATGVAATGTATALAWSSQLVAGIGLGGAVLVPAAVALQGGLTTAGTAFVAFVFAGSVAVAALRRWGRLLTFAGLTSFPQIWALSVAARPGDAAVLVLAGVFWLLYLGAGIAWQQGEPSGALRRRSASFVSAASVLALAAATKLLGTDAQGIALVLTGLATAALTLGVALRERLRELAPVLGLASLALVAIGLSSLLSGPGLAAAWAAEAALLAVLAVRVGDSRLELGVLGYLTLATLHVLILDAPPDRLLFSVGDPGSFAHAAHGVPVLLVLVAAYAVAARCSARPLSQPPAPCGTLGFTTGALAAFHRGRALIGAGEAVAAGALALYAAALAVLAGFHRWSSGSPLAAFEHAQVAVVACWSLAAVAAVVAGLHTGRPLLERFGLGWVAVTLAYEILYVLPELDRGARGWSALIVAAALLATAVAEQDRAGDELVTAGILPLPASVALAVLGVVELVPRATAGIQAQGAALLALAAVYGAVAAALAARGRRDLGSMVGLAALGIGAFAASELTSGTYLVLAWSAAAAVLAVLSHVVAERRLAAASGALLALALAHALLFEAPLSDLFAAKAHPATGVPALLIVVAAGLVLAVLAPPGYDRERELGAVGLAVLAVYACSLTVLGIAQELGGGDVAGHFQRGQTAVSTFWGLIGLGLLTVGLRRGERTLQLGGFALLGVSLAKIFLFDLPSLSSVTRALSFLGVGGLLLLSGYVYQRLTTGRELR
jgi:uncharacterized membrane protein